MKHNFGLLNTTWQVNTRMREAGFSGHSRGLKTMRDETTLINTIIASIQVHCGFEQAGILYHIVFGDPPSPFSFPFAHVRLSRRHGLLPSPPRRHEHDTAN